MKYRRNWVLRSTKIRRCAFVAVTAKVIGYWRWAYRNPDLSWNHGTKNWRRFKVKNPAVHVTGWPITTRGCNSTERWRIKAKINHGWHSWGCQLGVDTAVGFPWSVEFNPSYKCGKKRVGRTVSIEGPSRKTLHQYNSGVPVKFDGTLAPTSLGEEFNVVIVIRMHKKNASDRFKRVGRVHIK